MKITFPHMGNTYITAKAMLDDLGLDYVIPPSNSRMTLELGTKYAPELACLPLKINIGNYLQAYEQGADTIIITGGCGPCRFGYYCEMHREILKDLGCDMEIITLEWPDKGLPEFLRRIKKLAGSINPLKLAKVIKNVTQVALQVDELERLTFRTRPREMEKGSTDKIYKAFHKKVLEASGSREIKQVIRETAKQLSSIALDEEKKPLKVGIVGEIYTTIDSHTNFEIEALLGNMGIEVHRAVTVSGWIVEHMLKKALNIPRDMRYAEAAKPYLGKMIGGHAQETIGNTVLYARQGFDGVIQIYPLTCMPEIVAESILPAIERDYGIPILTLIIDEMTGEAGYLTRVEAFADLLKRRRERPSIGKDWALSGS
ncbi:CoA protein activase [Clostridium thermosuccinogenes]|uniref:CoA protein activase n=1 Tax=Clostridium thermosuccinogenes TaxID=84032 RepID=A0A2K2FAQ6_9CLOT|nr:acyl-CoA dehydratase activase-related protein [Pseudoclostridium thermosuccinogenes]AUS97792.1 CoA protein activase [Pseudoclostridium thermosuccinogenes]PNT95872.1 CoA protein activase [Pseudoclostridium thermosuccinogenes]PNT97226.1 CoA protein activase [Pseudoclostridium thermosuccinogenes]